MSMMLMVKAFHLKLGCSTRKLILLKLADNANEQTGECWPSYNHIADMCEIDKRTVQRHIKVLEEQGFLSIKARIGPKGNSSNLYRLTLDNPRGDILSPPKDKGEAHDHPMVAHDHHPIGTRSSEPVSEPVIESLAQATQNNDPMSFDNTTVNNITFDHEFEGIAGMGGFVGDVETEFFIFVGHHQSKGTGFTNRSRWNGAWRKWIGNAKGFQKIREAKQSKQQENLNEAFDSTDWAKEFNAEGRKIK